MLFNSKRGFKGQGKATLISIHLIFDFYSFLYLFFGLAIILLLVLFVHAVGALFGAIIGLFWISKGSYYICRFAWGKRCAEYALMQDIVPLDEVEVLRPSSDDSSELEPLLRPLSKSASEPSTPLKSE